ncbi:MAG: hypothetical protein ACRED0_00290 [Gammaproteobacteria bacterium]
MELIALLWGIINELRTRPKLKLEPRRIKFTDRGPRLVMRVVNIRNQKTELTRIIIVSYCSFWDKLRKKHSLIYDSDSDIHQGPLSHTLEPRAKWDGSIPLVRLQDHSGVFYCGVYHTMGKKNAYALTLAGCF